MNGKLEASVSKMEEVRIQGVFALEEKLAVQKQIKVLESQRDAKRRSPPVFEENTGAAVVTFQVNVAGAAQRTAQVTAQVTGQVTAQVTGQVSGQVTGQVGAKSQLESGPSRREVGTKSGLRRDQVKILRLCRKEGTSLEHMNSVGRKNRTKFREQFIKPLLDQRLLQMTIPDKPRSRLQRYRTTAAGESALSETVKK
jgi:ATP-dependent DNA helicase RecG